MSTGRKEDGAVPITVVANDDFIKSCKRVRINGHVKLRLQNTDISQPIPENVKSTTGGGWFQALIISSSWNYISKYFTTTIADDNTYLDVDFFVSDYEDSAVTKSLYLLYVKAFYRNYTLSGNLTIEKIE